MMLIAFLIALAVVAVAAACNVVSAALGLGVLPEFTGAWLFFAVKNYIADGLLWSLLAGGALMLVSILRDRLSRNAAVMLDCEPLPAEPRVAVVLTAYNEADCIADVVRDFRGQPSVTEVIVVDNNSRDATAVQAAGAGARVVHESAQGYGFACMRGLREALALGADVVVLAEGDGTFAARDIAKFLPYLDDADMVIGNRVTPGLVARDSQMDNFFVWGNKVAGKLLQLKFWEWRFLGRTRLSDVGCTMRAVRSDALAAFIDVLRVGGNHFSPHMMMAALASGLIVVEVPITFRPRVGASKGASQSLTKGIIVGLEMLWHIITYPTKHPAPYRVPRSAQRVVTRVQAEKSAA